MSNTKDIRMIERFLHQTSAVFKHRFTKNIFSSRLLLEELQEIVASDKPEQQDILRRIERLKASLEKIVSVADNHIDELLNLFKLHPVNLLEISERAINQIDASEISIEIEKPKFNINVKASQILTEHIVEILNNSVEATRKHYPTPKEKSGKITINFLKDNSKENLVELRISDNAGGVDPKFINQIAVSGFTTKSQTGMGLSLVQSYMESIGGALKYQNLYPNGFTVILIFQIVSGDSI